MDTVEIECPDCHYRRSANPSDLPSGKVSATCPRCGTRFPLPPRRHSPRPSPIEVPSPRSRTFPFTISPYFLLTAALLLVSLFVFVLFVGRIHSYYLPEEEVTIFKAVNYEPTSEPAANVPVLIEVELWKREALYWGDGSNIGENWRSIYFYTSTNSSGKLRVPGTRHRVFVKVPLGKSVSQTYRYYLPGKDVVADPEWERLSSPLGPVRIESPRDLIYVRTFSNMPAANILNRVVNGGVIPLTPQDEVAIRSYRRRR
jgi:hypothetical protein